MSDKKSAAPEFGPCARCGRGPNFADHVQGDLGHRYVAAADAPPSVAVDHPPHYNAHPSGVECITVVECFNFNVGNAIKYLWRAGLKTDLVEDMKKARWYIDREIQRVAKDQSK